MVRDSIATKLTNLPIGHSDRHLVFRGMPLPSGRMLQFSRQILLKKTNFTQTYAAFFETFQQMTRLSSLPISKPEHAETQKLGKHSVGNCNDNGLIPLELCTEQQLCITNSGVQQMDILKITWMHPR